MELTEAELVLGRVLAYLPKPDITDETTAAWFEMLEGVKDIGLFLDTVKQVAYDGAMWREPPGYYRNLYNEALKRRATTGAAAAALPSGERLASPEFAAKWIATIREQLDGMTGPLFKGKGRVV